MTDITIPADIETPCYVYDMGLLRRTIDAALSAAPEPNYHIHYALKANANPRILRYMASRGLGADTVSGGEIEAALEAGFAAERIVFAGVGKTDAEIRRGLTAGIGMFNVESFEELRVISEIAQAMGTTARVSVRVNPDIDAHTHHYITTGLAENKFGVAAERLTEFVREALSLPAIDFRGLHFHIGSQITDMEPYRVLCERANAFVAQVEALGATVSDINVGGGLGIDYDTPDAHPIPDFEAYFEVFRKHLHLRDDQQLHFELGRALVAQCGSLVSRVTYVKQGVGKQFVILDAGMTDLIRPALYQAHHAIENLDSDLAPQTYDVVGPICESSDSFGSDVTLPQTRRGDRIALRSAGAYGEAMASRYNCRPLPGAVFVD